MNEYPWLSSAVVAAIVGALLAFFARWHEETRRNERIAKASKVAMQQEVDNAGETAAGYLHPESPKAPAYRLSTLLYKDALPKLLSLGHLTPEATQALITFYNHVDSFNRSLDDITEHRSNGRNGLMVDEMERACLKAIMIAPARSLLLLAEMTEQSVPVVAHIRMRLREHGGKTHYDRARSALGFL